MIFRIGETFNTLLGVRVPRLQVFEKYRNIIGNIFIVAGFDSLCNLWSGCEGFVLDILIVPEKLRFAAVADVVVCIVAEEAVGSRN